MKNKRTVLEVFVLVLTLTMIGGLADNVTAAPQADFIFSVKLIAPTSNPVRMQYSQLMEQELPKIGIDAELDLISWAALGPRATDQEVGPYAQGGYDICFFGMSLGTAAGHPGDSMQGVYGAEAIPPAGFNVMYWSNRTGEPHNSMELRAAESNQLIADINAELDLTVSKGMLADWQKIWYDVMPNVIIYNQYEVHAVSTGLFGYDPVAYPLSSLETVYTTADYTGPDDTTVVLAQSTAGDTFNTMIATDVYDQYTAGPITDGLVGNAPSEEMALPTGEDRETFMTDNFGTDVYLGLYPRIAKEMGTFTDGGLTYTIELKEDVYWHDGEVVDAWDVVFSFQARLVPANAASTYSNLKTGFGDDDKAGKHGNYSFEALDTDTDGFFETVVFHLADTWAPFLTDYLGSALFPEHILGDPTDHGFDTNGDFDPVAQWLVAPGSWDEHSTNTANPADAGGFNGPIGCGSYYFEGRDQTTGTVTLKKFEGMKWDGTDYVADATVNHWMAADTMSATLWGRMVDTAIAITSDSAGALADIKTGDVNILDPQFTLASILDELQADAAIEPILSTETGWQAIYFNPKYAAATELGADDHPLDRKGVRHAVSHMVPRDDIITYLLNGLGVSGYTPVPVTSWAAISRDDMLAYKKTLQATDGSTPEAAATTASDSYDKELALDWLASEGYDVTAFRGAQAQGPVPGFEVLVFLVAIIGTVGILRKRRR
jgi:ABC-type transport system substrate-binding protein